MANWDELIEHLCQPGVDGDPAHDVLKLQPDLTLDQALALQLAVKRRREGEGDRIVGHQASFTSAGVRVMFPDAPRPMIGTLLASLMRNSGDEVVLDCERTFIESELGLILKRDVEGPNVARSEVLAAIEGFVPAIEVAPLRPGSLERAYSYQHMIAVQKAKGGFVVLGSKITAPHAIDPRLEGCLVSIDGEAKAGAVGFEAMGNHEVIGARCDRGEEVASNDT